MLAALIAPEVVAAGRAGFAGAPKRIAGRSVPAGFLGVAGVVGGGAPPATTGGPELARRTLSVGRGPTTPMADDWPAALARACFGEPPGA
ncbi:MAG: hypothetical protein VYD05_09005, partial [Planctomycetota bacterium]|nr:hypothetical protein [Planctomycetota bacterium]